ncbi:hypothetical protein HYZ64_00830 [Candidatus Berkelbacteria bacterium]|nr:hypothetical protein [Candidatus Berkelbacteria bacterium]
MKNLVRLVVLSLFVVSWFVIASSPATGASATLTPAQKLNQARRAQLKAILGPLQKDLHKKKMFGLLDRTRKGKFLDQVTDADGKKLVPKRTIAIPQLGGVLYCLKCPQPGKEALRWKGKQGMVALDKVSAGDIHTFLDTAHQIYPYQEQSHKKARKNRRRHAGFFT